GARTVRLARGAGGHGRAPAPGEAALVALAGVGLRHVADRARELEPVVLERARGAPEPHLVVVGILPGDGPAARLVGVVPVLHVVLLGEPGRTGIADVVVAQDVLHLGGRVGVDQVPAPDLGLVRPARVPHRERARLARERRGVGEHRAGATEEPPVLAATALALLLAVAEVLRDDRRVLVGGSQRRVVLAEKRDHRVAELGERDVEPARLVPLLHVAPPLTARADADHVHRAVAHAVIALAR